MSSYFFECFEIINQKKSADDVILSQMNFEDSEFCRFNNGHIRQLGSVKQMNMSIQLVRGDKQVSSNIQLAGHLSLDRDRLLKTWDSLDKMILQAERDPYILYNKDICNSEKISETQLPELSVILNSISKKVAGTDFVGILAKGHIGTGFCNSLGQRNWYQTESFNLDFSIYHHGDKAVKGGYGGFEWNDDAFSAEYDRCLQQLDVFSRPARVLKAGNYRAYLAPSAVSEIFDLLNWEAFSHKKLQSKQSSLCLLENGTESLNPMFDLSEDTAAGIAADFDGQGFVKPSQVPLIIGGKYAGSLVSARSAKEFGLEPLGASSGEWAQSLHLKGGQIEDALADLGTGLYINNLWYMNYSDKHACRLTGMTRFATLWVEDGKVKDSVDVMRFDDSFFEMFGQNLEGLTKTTSMIMGNSTYDQRETSSQILPGALLSKLQLTL